MAYCGSDFLVKLGDDGSPESFTTIAAMTATENNLQAETVDITDKDNSNYRQLLDSCGVVSDTITLSGYIDDSADKTTLATLLTSRASRNFQLASGAGDTITGAFRVTQFQRSGNHNGSEEFSITLESAGDLTFA